jgi:arsenite methyltransferase
VGHIKFFSVTCRLFKHPDLEASCEDYGEAVIYKGTISTTPKVNG